jgi:hydrogenase-4 component E
MNGSTATIQILASLNSLAAGLFLLSAFAIVATRQVKGCLGLFIGQSLLLAASAFLLGILHSSWHLYGVALVNVLSKAVLIPLILRRTMHREVYTRREINQVLNIPASLLIALVLTILSYFLAGHLQGAVVPDLNVPNVAVGIAGLLLGAFTLTVRREAVPLLIGLLAMENSVFFTGIAMAPDLPLLVELAAATDGLIIAFIMGVLTRATHKRIGTTEVGFLANLKEEVRP